MPNKLPDRDYLLSRLVYNPDTGLLTYLPRPRAAFRMERLFLSWNKNWAGKVAGTKANPQEVTVSLDGLRWRAHRLIWKMVHGDEPPEIDHADGDPHNNRLDNLRIAEHWQNVGNAALRTTNTSGFKGVNYSKAMKKYHARVVVAGKRVHLGFFDTFEEATEARRRAAEETYGEFVRHV